MKKDFMFISESVTQGHPDKLCDQISDAIVDHFLRHDPYSRVVTECAVSTAIVFIAARFQSDAMIDFPKIARQVIKQVGYEESSFSAKTCSIVTSLQEVASMNDRYVDERQLSDEEIEAIPVKNQATVFGFACRQTPALMPLPIWLAHQLAKRLTQVRQDNILSYLTPDGKTQVGVEYRDRLPYRLQSITVIASQDSSSIAKSPNFQQFQQDIRETVIDAVFADDSLLIKPDQETQIFINPDGPLLVGGPAVHSGLTGRKNAIDTYGEYSRHSGAALSGKDPTRIDRIGAYAARYAAKNLVAAGLADECEVQLSYSIGIARPISIQVQTFGTGKVPDEMLTEILEKHFEFRLAGIIKQFNLRFLPSLIKGGFYRKLAAYGHVGRTDLGVIPWEETNQISLLHDCANKAYIF
ncbi:Methionine adenosyltransferase [Rippkaea orientalis PCC 8801]|uniref:Methionine adenosyltransferase n=1 Tax=Rippkaea orientalis (strain PCC 8801 / RF-1) TaxID=41431 RepID=B7JWE6_RIPO1|nr:methionine adenosyltransferase [Rippkaea orientalis]ACK66991.1 Methionine adenosyltransferase [Rippkaea orientalis PCC 8801]